MLPFSSTDINRTLNKLLNIKFLKIVFQYTKHSIVDISYLFKLIYPHYIELILLILMSSR
jgi:hypothetical protein